MKIFIFLFTLLLSVMSNSVSAQVSDEMTAAERKAFQEKLDSLMFVEAEKAIFDKDFTLEADKIEFKYGQTAFVNSNTNFVSVKGDKSVVQVAFNIPVPGPNGIGGITMDGNVSNYEIKKALTDDYGVAEFKIFVTGIPISERLSLEIGDPKEPVQMKVSDIDYKVIDTYVEADIKNGAADSSQKGKGIKAFLAKTEQEATKNLNELKSKLEGINNNGGNVGEQSFGNIDKVVSMVSQFINFITTNVFKAYNTLFAIAEQAIKDYIQAYNIQL